MALPETEWWKLLQRLVIVEFSEKLIRSQIRDRRWKNKFSMLSMQVLSKIDSRLRQLTRNKDLPFGGKNLILVGDLN